MNGWDDDDDSDDDDDDEEADDDDDDGDFGQFIRYYGLQLVSIKHTHFGILITDTFKVCWFLWHISPTFYYSFSGWY